MVLNRISSRRKPKLPTPPASPRTGRGASTPSPPPPPPEDNEFIACSEPLPPPPNVIGGNRSRSGYTAGAGSPGDQQAARLTAASSNVMSDRGMHQFSDGNISYTTPRSQYPPGSVGGYTSSDSINQPVRRSVPPPTSINSSYSNNFQNSLKMNKNAQPSVQKHIYNPKWKNNKKTFY